MKINLIITISLLGISSHAFSQSMTPEEYVSKYYQLAVDEMNKYKIPASITLAQGMYESNNGNSKLAVKANNHFGIKCKEEWTGMTIYHTDDAPNECFRAYNNADESYRDHSIFLTTRDRYQELFNYEIQDYKSWAYGLKAAGYATNANYAPKLIKLIEDYKLYRYDSYGLNNKSNEKEYDPNSSSNNSSSSNQAIPPPTVSTNAVATKPTQIASPKTTVFSNNLKLIVVDKNFDIDKISKDYNIPVKKLLTYNELDGEQNVRIGQNFFLEPKLSVNKKGTHVVKKGESLYDLSQFYGITVSSLKSYNKLNNWEQPEVGETLALAPNYSKQVKKRFYYLTEVDKYDMLKNSLISNPIEGNPGNTPAPSKVETPTQSTPVTTTPPVSKTDGGAKVIKASNIKSYTVKTGDTIFKVAKIYGVSPNEVLEWNNLNLEDDLEIGRELVILK